MEELEVKIKYLIERLEELKELHSPDIDSLREQIDSIEYDDFPVLEEKYHKLKDSDEVMELPLEYVEDRLLYANSLICKIRGIYGLEYPDDEEDIDTLIRVPMEDKENNVFECDTH